MDAPAKLCKKRLRHRAEIWLAGQILTATMRHIKEVQERDP